MVDTPAWERRFTATQIELPGLDRQRPRPSRVRIERGRLVAGLDDRPGHRRSSAGSRTSRSGWKKHWSRQTDESCGGRTTSGTRPGDGWPPRSTGLRLGPWSKVSRRAGDRGSRSRERATSRSGSARKRTTVRTSSAAAGSPRLIRADPAPIGVGRLEPAGTGGLSADGSLVCLRHAEHGDIVHEALRVVDRPGRDRRRAGRRGIEPRPRRVEPGPRRPSVALHLGARPVRTTRALGPRERRAA